MSFFSTDASRPLGAGLRSAAGSLTDDSLAAELARYKRNVASRYRAITAPEIPIFASQRLLVSPKIDGETWFLVMRDGDVALANPRGRVLSGALPVLDEARTMAARAGRPLVFPGELFALRKNGRPRHGDLAAAISAGEVDRIGFTAFDVIDPEHPDDGSLSGYAARLDVMRDVLSGGKRLRAVTTEEVGQADGVARLYREWVEAEKAEGLVVRAQGGIYKVKPVVDVDAVVVGYTLRGPDPDQARSLLLAVFREAGQVQILGSCGNLGTDDDRRALAARLRALDTESAYRHASSDGALYQFVRPEVVVAVRVNDIQAEGSEGDPVPRMVLTWSGSTWVAVQKLPGVSLIGPILSRVRDDKTADVHDAGVDQVTDRVLLPELGRHAEAAVLPASEVIRREAYSKVAAGVVSVRKLLVWKTNKEALDPRYPAYVVHWTDYSPGRKDPLKRTVRLAPTAAIANDLADELAADGAKRGWERVK